MRKKPDKERNGGEKGELYDESDKENVVISVKCPYFMKEHIDCKDKMGSWENGEIISVFITSYTP